MTDSNSVIQKARDHLNPLDINLVIYRKNCCDSIASCFAAWKLLGDTAEYIGVSSGDPIPELSGKTVAILNYTYSRDILENINDITDGLIVLVHDNIIKNGRDWVYSDPAMASSHISWCYFHDAPLPTFLSYIEDRELNRWELENTKNFTAAFYTCVKFDCNEYNKYLDEDLVRETIIKGKYIREYNESIIDIECSRACQRKLYNWNVLVLNASRLVTDIGMELAKKSDFSIVWFFDHVIKKYRVSLKSIGKVNVGKIAKKYKGGGTFNEAKFIWSDPIETLFNNN
jgi:hypothetical protein